MKIFHTSDLHLGRRRLDGRLPDQDLADAFGWIADKAIEEKADVFVLAGDLFDRPQVEPPHLRQAQEILQRLKAAEIPVVAIEGNHDKAFIHSGSPTWVQFLADDDLLVLLRPEFGSDGAILKRWNPEKRTGAFVDIDGVRFVGAGYLGAATPNKVRQILEKLMPDTLHVMLLHAGPDYFVGEGGGFSKDDLKMIEEAVCYLALGHIHKPMIHGKPGSEWACNPGSPENCDLREVAYGFDKKTKKPQDRGYAVLEIDPQKPDKPKSFELRSNPRRDSVRLELDCTTFGNKLKGGAEALVKAAVDTIRHSVTTPESVVELGLAGKLNLNRIAIDGLKAATEIANQAGVFAVSIDMSGLNVDSELSSVEGREVDGVSREALERNAIQALVENDHLWGLEAESHSFTDFFFNLKEAVQHQTQADELAEMLTQSPLVGKIVNSKKGIVIGDESVETDDQSSEAKDEELKGEPVSEQEVEESSAPTLPIPPEVEPEPEPEEPKTPPTQLSLFE